MNDKRYKVNELKLRLKFIKVTILVNKVRGLKQEIKLSIRNK